MTGSPVLTTRRLRATARGRAVVAVSAAVAVGAAAGVEALGSVAAWLLLLVASLPLVIYNRSTADGVGRTGAADE